MNEKNILFYDGECGFCHESVKLIFKMLKINTILYFSALQGTTARLIKKQRKEFPEDLSSIILLKDGELFKASKAFFKLAPFFKFPYNSLYLLSFFPTYLLDLFYKLIASKRHLIKDKTYKDLICEVPSEEMRNKFLS